MNNGTLIPAIWVGVITAVLTGPAAANIDDNLLLRYSFNEGRGNLAVDQTGYGFDAELHDGAVFIDNYFWTQGGSAKFGNAIKLDGAGDYLAIENAFYNNRDRLNPGTIAISTWIKPVTAAGTGHQYIVSKIDHSLQKGYALRIDATTGMLRGEVYLNGGGLATVVGSTPITNGQWTHAAFIYDGQYLQLFVNDSPDATPVAAGGAIVASAAKLMVGAPPTGSLDAIWFNGQVDELRLYSALDAAGVSSLKNSAGGEPGLIFYESFDTIPVPASFGGEYTFPIGVVDATDLIQGPFDNALRLQDSGQTDERLSISAAGRVNGQKGHISFWYRPDYGPEDTDWHTILGTDDEGAVGGIWFFRRGLVDDEEPEFRFRAHAGATANTGGNYLISERMEPAVAQAWQAGEWHHIEVIWDLTATPKYMAYVVDGEIADAQFTDYTLPDPAPVAPSTLYIGSDSNGWPMAGAIDELKIYAQPQYVPVTNFWGNSKLNGEANIRAFKSGNAGDGIPQPHETVYNSADAAFPSTELAAEDAIAFYQTAPFERVYAGTVPDAADVSDTLNYRAARNDSESLFFNIYSQTDATDVTVTLSDLKTLGGTSVVDAADMSLRVVKNWWQRTPNDFPDFQPYFPVWVPELLMYDDRVNFKHDDYDAGTQESYAPGDLPSFPIPTTAEVQTELPAFTSKQFMAGLTLPDTLAPGTYRLTATVTGTNISGSRTVTLEIDIDNIVLPEADKDFQTYHRAQYLGTPTQGEDNDFVSQQVYLAELQDIRAHGLNGLTVYGNDPDYIADLTSVGFGAGDKIMFRYNHLDPNVSLSLTAPLRATFGEAWFLGKDEPDNIPVPNVELQDQMAWASVVHSASFNSKLASGIFLEWADCLKNPHRQRPNPANVLTDFCPYTGSEILDPDEHTDLENLDAYHSGVVQGYLTGLLNGSTAKDDAVQSYYWQSRTEDARVNRYMAGVHLYLTDLNGIFPYVYNHNNGTDPYDDMDGSYGKDNREMGMIYPTQQGPMTTIEWEALREGIDDYRYLQLWKSLHASMLAIDTTEADRSEDLIQYELGPYRWGIKEVLDTTDNDAFDVTRQTVANEIIELQKGLEPPDLLEATLSAAVSGSSFQINDRVINSGNGLEGAGAFSIKYYLSTNNTYQGTDTLLCSRNVSGLAKGASNPTSGTTQTNCSIPGGTTGGNYYILAVVDADAAVDETNEANNVTAASVSLSGIDLRPTAFSTAQGTGQAVKEVTVTHTVTNQGSVSSGGFTNGYYLSTNTSYESGDIPLAANQNGNGTCTRAGTSLSAGSSATNSKLCYRPKVNNVLVTGTYYVLMFVDNATPGVSEYNETNNVAVSATQVTW